MDTDSQLEVAQVFATVACDLASQPDSDAVERRISAIATNVIGCPWAQVVHLTERGTLSYSESSDDTLRAVTRISTEESDDIVSETVMGQGTIVVPDLAQDHRWPDFSSRVLAETSVRSAMSFLLRLGDTDLGALAMYSDTAGFFDDRMVEIGALLADHASIAVSHVASADRAHNLEIALMTNRKIGVAIGVLMARMSITDLQAFDLLRRTSQNTHRKLRDVAEYVTMTGELPSEDGSSEVPRAIAEAV